ncbi:MAG TPA: DUF3137 domain-containing protein [Caulobacteraceae bacterium]|nr:DUF3137 domain-containing protein [Caulobacteraceae bacterium]
MSNAADPLAPIEGAGFDQVYAERIEPEIQRLEAARQKAMCRLLIIGGIAFAAAALENVAGLDVRIVLATAVIGAIVAYMPLAQLGAMSKRAVVQALCSAIDVTYAESAFEPPDYNAFIQLKLLPPPTSKRFEDHFSGRAGDAAFALCEAVLEQGSGKNMRVVFRGQIFQLITQKRRLATTVILRDSGWLDHFECPPGLKKVGLEDPEFEKLFEVFGADQVEAREIITPTFMQHLVEMERAYAGAHLRCAFVGPDVLIAIEGPNRFETGALLSNLAGRARAQAVVRDLQAVFRLMTQVQAL